MMTLRLRAIEELGIKFSTELLYEKLTAACNPKNFTGEAYNKERLELANRLYQEVLMNADNVFALEGIEEEAKELMNNMTANTALEKQSDKDNNDGCLTYLIIISALCLCFLLITLLVMVFNAN